VKPLESLGLEELLDESEYLHASGRDGQKGLHFQEKAVIMIMNTEYVII